MNRKKDIKTGVSLPPSQNVWPLRTRDGSETQTHHDSTIITSTEDQGWKGTVCRGCQKRLQVVDRPGYVEDSFQSRRKGRQTTSGQLQTPVSREWQQGLVQQVVGQEGVCQKSGWVQLDVTCIKRRTRCSALKKSRHETQTQTLHHSTTHQTTTA